jgi:hypothetical protein
MLASLDACKAARRLRAIMISFNHRILQELGRVISRLWMRKHSMKRGHLLPFAESARMLSFHDANNLFIQDSHPNRPEGVAP